jgi:hypothetical protein
MSMAMSMEFRDHKQHLAALEVRVALLEAQLEEALALLRAMTRANTPKPGRAA